MTIKFLLATVIEYLATLVLLFYIVRIQHLVLLKEKRRSKEEMVIIDTNQGWELIIPDDKGHPFLFGDLRPDLLQNM
jgi:hypothetical protein